MQVLQTPIFACDNVPKKNNPDAKVFIYTIYKLYSALNTIIFNRGSLFIFNF